jgi:hypothetical protein
MLDSHEILVYSLASFTVHWNLFLSCDADPPASRATSITLAAHAGLVDADTCIVSLYASGIKKLPGSWSLGFPRAVFLRYRLTTQSWSL